MIVYVPQSDFDSSVAWLHPADLAETAFGALEVVRAIHEQHELTPWLDEHPSIAAWRGYEVPLIGYGMRCADRIRALVDEDEQGFVLPSFFRDSVLDELLEKNLSLATSDETFTMDPPSWMGNWKLHFSHRQHLVTAHPERYVDELANVAHGNLYYSFGSRLIFH